MSRSSPPNFKRPETLKLWNELHPGKQALVRKNWGDFDDPDAVVMQLHLSNEKDKERKDRRSPSSVGTKKSPVQAYKAAKAPAQQEPAQRQPGQSQGHKLFPDDKSVAQLFDSLPQSKQDMVVRNWESFYDPKSTVLRLGQKSKPQGSAASSSTVEAQSPPAPPPRVVIHATETSRLTPPPTGIANIFNGSSSGGGGGTSSSSSSRIGQKNTKSSFKSKGAPPSKFTAAIDISKAPPPKPSPKQRMTFAADLESVTFSPTAATAGAAAGFDRPGVQTPVSLKSKDEDEVSATPRSKLSSDRRLSGVLRVKRNACNLRNKGSGAAAAAAAPDTEMGPAEKCTKSDAVRENMREALERNFLLVLDLLTAEDMDEVIDVMWWEEIKDGEVLIEQGSMADYFYVVERGVFDVLVDGARVNQIGPWGSFGEMALLYNCPRTASVTANFSAVAAEEGGLEGGVGKVWLLDRGSFDLTLGCRDNYDLKDTLDTLRLVPLLEALSDAQLKQLAETVQPVQFSAGELVIRKGERGSIFYIVKSGSVVCSDITNSSGSSSPSRRGATAAHSGVVVTLTAGEYFGERALLLNEPRSANVMAETSVTAYALDRQGFHELRTMIRSLPYHSFSEQSLNDVQLLSMLTPADRDVLVQACRECVFTRGQYIVTQGQAGSEFFIIKEGTVTVTKTKSRTRVGAGKGAGKERDREREGEQAAEDFVASLTDGDYFGEMVLLAPPAEATAGARAVGGSGVAVAGVGVGEGGHGHVRKRAANVIATSDSVTCYALSKPDFDGLLISGALKSAGSVIKSSQSRRRLELAMAHHSRGLQLGDLVQLGDLGDGAFGKVKLVRHREAEDELFALKIMQKSVIVSQRQQTNVLNEKAALKQADHPFVLRMVGTMKDTEKLYLCLELCKGKELFHYMRVHRRFDESASRFYTACTLLALQHLHSKNILYRDLKPENLMVDETGYIKCVDFGFAKVVIGKTYTMCGTPEYMCPELVMGDGHGRGVDYWALGVLLFEMLCGYTPFADPRGGNQDQLAVLQRVVKGEFKCPEQYMRGSTKALVTRLLTKLAARRLGCGLGGANDVKRQRIFQELNWDDLLSKNIAPPWLPDAVLPTEGEKEAVALAKRRGSCRRDDIVEAMWDEAF